ncbi:unnamed protein product [Fusarium graminearum]|nr:unnamed protein product [Fusarium graminearum]VTO85355.1 unnamed protein product [Fusarium graminearum]
MSNNNNNNNAGDRSSQESVPLIAEAEQVTLYKPPKEADKAQLHSSTIKSSSKPIELDDNVQRALSSGFAAQDARRKGKGKATADQSKPTEPDNNSQAIAAALSAQLRREGKAETQIDNDGPTRPIDNSRVIPVGFSGETARAKGKGKGTENAEGQK